MVQLWQLGASAAEPSGAALRGAGLLPRGRCAGGRPGPPAGPAAPCVLITRNVCHVYFQHLCANLSSQLDIYLEVCPLALNVPTHLCHPCSPHSTGVMTHRCSRGLGGQHRELPPPRGPGQQPSAELSRSWGWGEVVWASAGRTPGVVSGDSRPQAVGAWSVSSGQGLNRAWACTGRCPSHTAGPQMPSICGLDPDPDESLVTRTRYFWPWGWSQHQAALGQPQTSSSTAPAGHQDTQVGPSAPRRPRALKGSRPCSQASECPGAGKCDAQGS